MNKLVLQYFYLVIISFGLNSCSRDDIQAEKSLEGEWIVTEISSTYGEYTSNNFQPTSTVPESGNLGTFKFLSESVEYSFTRNDTLYSGNESWNLGFEKVNEGFTRTNKFTLTIGAEFVFDVSFEDETKNAEKNATYATFMQFPDMDSKVQIQLKVEKR